MLLFTRNILWCFWLVAGSASLGILLATTIPSKTAVYFTDRKRFQRLVNKGPEGRPEEALLKLIAQTTADNSVKNISLLDTHVLQTDVDLFMRFWGFYYEYEYYKANGDAPGAENAKANLPGMKASVSKPIWNALKIGE